MSKVPLHSLSGFAAAARNRNLTRAAESMHVTVSALSHQIRALEERLGRRLFERGPRGVVLTADGERLLARIGPHLDAIEHALQPFAARHDDVLTLSVTPSIASNWLVPRLPGFLAAHPQLEISLQSNTAVVNFEQDRDIDAALRIGHGNWSGVISEHLFDDWLAPVASPALVAQFGGLPTAGDLHRWPLLGDPDPANHWAAWFARYGGSAPVRYAANFDDSEAMHRAAAAGVGVALGRLSRVRLLLESGQLVLLTDERQKTDYAHYLVYPPRAADHAGLRTFRDWIHGEACSYAVKMDAETSSRPTPTARSRKKSARGGA